MSADHSFAHWPVPVGRVEIRSGLTYVHASGPGGFSVEAFRRVPDARVDLLDGVVVVRPALTPAQRQVVNDLYEQLCDRCPKGLVVADGRRGVRAGPATVFRPDIQLVPEQLVSGGDGGTRPLLVVEARPPQPLHGGVRDETPRLPGCRYRVVLGSRSGRRLRGGVRTQVHQTCLLSK